MKLWLLEARYDLPKDEEGNPWIPWYDKTFSFVVRAESETQARQLAQDEGSEEVEDANKVIPAWTDPLYSTCIELEESGEAGVIIENHHAA